jgi:hypothetical protein
MRDFKKLLFKKKAPFLCIETELKYTEIQREIGVFVVFKIFSLQKKPRFF